MTRYRCVDAQKAAGFAATAACEAVEVSTTAYYQWVAGETHEPGDKERADAALLAEIRDIHAHMDETYGSPRMTFELTRRGWQANEKRVARLMREHGLVGYRPVKRASTTQRDTGEPPMPDLVGRHFDPAWPDHVWCGDLTYVPTGEGWLYVATVIDLASRRLIGWSMSDTPDAQLMIAALDHAVAERGVVRMNGVIFHHDRGTQYMSEAFAQACWRLGVTQSASRHRLVPGQRRGRELLRDVEGRARQPLPLPDPTRSAHIDLPVDRPVQRQEAALDAELLAADRVGTSTQLPRPR
ncbi:IS3 family transposase [Egibacter rhizosphaerae]|uniref:IS3 family transposase n=1 Tax=Egibacter rhizosphaerae TaxID=1670831 RepID=A0A411YAV2_9ACTN|nr:IS3 family transposase [Egibacter rhizosphaerae]QBI18363.1 IS3 family transposase [Egibacter rhizosphaerae]